MSHLSSICLCEGGAYLDVKVVEVLGPGDEGLTQVNAGQAVHLYASSVLDLLECLPEISFGSTFQRTLGLIRIHIF